MKLVILAAGLGSRYGGLKQLDPITPHGEFIIDFSCYDAVKAGFNEVVFIIKKENYELFSETIGARVSKAVKVSYAFQDVTMLPEGYTLPEGRTRPWGTGHALLCARENIGDDSFVVINADDFYGYEPFEALAKFMKNQKSDGKNYCMSGFMLKNTLTENGSVSRGVCEVDSKDNLISVTERTKIIREKDDRVVYIEDGKEYPLHENSTVSMNFWGFTSGSFVFIEKCFREFLDSLADSDKLKKEYYIPLAVSEMIRTKSATVKVLPTNSKWFGVTYAEDKPGVMAEISKLISGGFYPDGLWK